MLFNSLLISTLLLISIGSIHSKRKWEQTNLWIYEQPDGSDDGFSYFENFDEFDNLELLVKKHGMSQVGQICILEGVFVFYAQPDFWADSADEVRVLSGHYKCQYPGELPIGSIHHAGNKFISLEFPQIVLYEGTNFGGHRLNYATASTSFIKWLDEINSLIFIGPSKWMVETQSGETFCLVPFNVEKLHETQVCLVHDTTSIFPNGTDLRFKMVEKDCEGGGTEIKIENCFDYLTGEVQKPAIGEPAPSGNGTTTGSGDGLFSSENCEDYEELAHLLRWRLTHNFENPYQYILPKNKSQTWRTELLDASFEVTASTLAPVLDEGILLIMREFYIYFAEKMVWSQGKGWPEAGRTFETSLVVDETHLCVEKLQEKSMDKERGPVFLTILEHLEGQEFPEEFLSSKLRPASNLDPLMEFVWLVINFTAIACHIAQDFVTNFWIDYTTVASDMLLVPMSEFWINNGMVKQYYPVIFAGFPYKKILEEVAVFTTEMYNQIKGFQAMPRPDAVQSHVQAPK
ncbi:hypothetical protein Ocin01_16328 [Orchesella cincta]|uniref:Uncharacterized protein n=1 Tax=Orchesella cincta TaxID=48709 RepID=A0A1D2MBT8_ORCCI|nr:hypothetical protein Ocin01_16328 [Orchesella cincta]